MEEPQTDNQDPEREYGFVMYDKDGKVKEQITVKESDLTEEQCFILADGFFRQFNYLPETSKMYFVRRIMNDAVAEQKAIAEDQQKNKPGRIITFDN